MVAEQPEQLLIQQKRVDARRGKDVQRLILAETGNLLQSLSEGIQRLLTVTEQVLPGCSERHLMCGSQQQAAANARFQLFYRLSDGAYRQTKLAGRFSKRAILSHCHEMRNEFSRIASCLSTVNALLKMINRELSLWFLS